MFWLYEYELSNKAPFNKCFIKFMGSVIEIYMLFYTPFIIIFFNGAIMYMLAVNKNLTYILTLI